MFHG
jgi:hypothetical protein